MIKMVQVQLRLPEENVKEIDELVIKGKFKSRSDAIKTIIALYQEREKTREFYKMLIKRSEEVKKNPDILIPLEET
ncbi:MAG: ribbon-helix-helix protein, CopG family [Candidatus Aenigmarchaeota archaeon]|nr:ribbon-helix-helix protein, CopG family [Candidatus Aenigmarchaeota archaeon]